MATQEKYQGWANWETWNVALWFGNDQGLYHAVREHPTKFTAASAKAFTKEQMPDGTPDFKSARSYSKVDWKEIAADFNEMRGDGVSETRGAWHPRVRAVEDERPYVRWEVIVGNVGTVFDGTRESAARQAYKDYVIKSKSGNGRAGGEDVTLMKNGEPVDEHFGSNGVMETPSARESHGYYVMKWGGGRYTSIGWFSTRQEAQKEIDHIRATGSWSGMPPKIEPAAPAGSPGPRPLREHPYPPSTRRPAALPTRPLPRRR